MNDHAFKKKMQVIIDHNTSFQVQEGPLVNLIFLFYHTDILILKGIYLLISVMKIKYKNWVYCLYLCYKSENEVFQKKNGNVLPI